MGSLDTLGIDARQIRDALADDMSRRCPEREAAHARAASNRNVGAEDSGGIIPL